MKIAVASSDGKSVSQHFGRSRCFIVFEADEGKITGREVRDNRYTAHARGECGDGERDHSQAHSHADIVQALHDCKIILCGGMGWRAAEELKANGVEPLVMDPGSTPEQAVADFLAGRLKGGPSFCCCHE